MKKFIYSTVSIFIYAFSLGQQSVDSSVKGTQYATDSIAIFSEEPQKPFITWGLTAGFNMHHLHGKDLDYLFADTKSSFKPGGQIGVFVRSQIGKQFSLNHELQVSQRRLGIHLNDIHNGTYASNIQMMFLDLMPANLTYQFQDFEIYAGPYVSTLISGSILRKDENGRSYRDKSLYGGPADDESQNKYLQKLDFGVNAGVNYKVNKQWMVSARYTHGFIPLFQHASSYDKGQDKDVIRIYNSGFGLILSYTL